MADAFYAAIEDGVRPWVRILREAGLNTECSCGHEGYIQCQSLDLPTELERIKSVLHSHGCWTYEIHFRRYSNGPDFRSWIETIEVRSPMFKADLVGESAQGKEERL